jgi:hypothetical protein
LLDGFGSRCEVIDEVCYAAGNGIKRRNPPTDYGIWWHAS